MKTDTCEGRPDHCSVSALTVCQAFNRFTIAMAMYRELGPEGLGDLDTLPMKPIGTASGGRFIPQGAELTP